ncbi:collagenase-like [Drosophila rhopaloa]|uniref:Collagenase-like n=1 Tax=Drosophila rhopaloa TaxID=1041015 RepID=A0A6P4F6T3_DRORH|nr:collagenase-like [Drosophila rhopaloa]
MSTAPCIALCVLLMFQYGSSVLLEKNCGRFKNIILNTPWLVSIRAGEKPEVICVGTLINERFVLTAASCIHNQSSLKVRLGEIVENNNTKYAKYKYVEMLVLRAIKHKLYSPGSDQNNIGLLRLPKDVVYMDHIQPICIELNTDKSSRHKRSDWEWLPKTSVGYPKVQIVNDTVYFQTGILSRDNVITAVREYAEDWILPTALEVDVIQYPLS